MRLTVRILRLYHSIVPDLTMRFTSLPIFLFFSQSFFPSVNRVMGPIRNQSNEFDLNADFIEFPPDSDSDLEEDASSIQFDKETIVKLLSLRGAYAGINDQPVVTDDEFAMALDYIPFVQEHTMPIREDTINQPAPDYIPVEEYDEDMCVISDSEDEHMEDEIIHLSSDSEPEDRNMGDGDVIEISSDEEEYAPSVSTYTLD